MTDIKEKLFDLKKVIGSDDLSIEGLQRALSQLLYSSDIPNVERVVKKYDNELELIIYTISPSRQNDEACKVIDKVMIYMDENSI